MDWSRTKTIFIIAFLLLNIILGFQIYTKQLEYLQDIQSTNSIQELTNLLKLQELELLTEIPKGVPELHFLQVKKTDSIVERNLVDPIQLEQQIIPNQTNIKIQKTINHFSEYEYDIFSSSSDEFVYNQRIEGYPYFGSSLLLQLSNEKVIGYIQDFYEIVDKGPDRQVISANSALRTVLDHQLIPKGSKVQEIKLGFYKQPFPDDIKVFVPVWRIVYQSNLYSGVAYINAMTGGVEQTENMKKQEFVR